MLFVKNSRQFILIRNKINNKTRNNIRNLITVEGTRKEQYKKI